MNETGFSAQDAIERVEVSQRVAISPFQKLLDISSKTRTSMFPWRGQFSPQLVEHLISNYALDDGIIVDPFCGSGTVQIEAARLSRDSFGCDVNPAAIELARVVAYCKISMHERMDLVDQIEVHVARICRSIATEDLGAAIPKSSRSVKDLWGDIIAAGMDDELLPLMKILLMLAAKNTVSCNAEQLRRSLKQIKEIVLSLPISSNRLNACLGDARALPLEDNSVSYLLTSPPYINVFNYHQNYRPVVEAFGYAPLAAAVSEIGANRKHRANRFMTVIQYCMDMAQLFAEVGRVLRKEASATFVVGRESNVRRTAFKNGELLAAIGSEGLGMSVREWNERSFVNRFGKTIVEDVITFGTTNSDFSEAVQIGRAVGSQALRKSLEVCSSEVADEIALALNKADAIQPSPLKV